MKDELDFEEQRMRRLDIQHTIAVWVSYAVIALAIVGHFAAALVLGAFT